NPACRLRTTIFEEDKMRLNRFLGAALLTIAASAISQTAAAQLVLDDFSTGAYKKQLASGSDINVQSGSMIGGHRETAFLVCPPGPCGLTNQFGQTGSIQIRPATKLAPSALIYSAGFEVFPRVDVVYGSAAPLNLALAPTYDRIRVNFYASDLIVNFNIVTFTGGLYSQTGCNLSPSIGRVSIDFPLANFTPNSWTPGEDFANITSIVLIFQSGSAMGANDGAVTSFEAIPASARPAAITCQGLGK